ncbi:MAG: protein phosphatase 2C domain-containing protein [Gomphosphaeria aponina SAG 52.96 = DSM 107014]|uniref:Protein phosphatase 2C domain-containing protein n=1 Tax=Gomphosphaeria aponina SAG 52.96 = DSM 107014 TaxID=1521640 RepID=A0A941GWF6_9CHRO|nr:protein phosphatase 2C domain-containing protein [Gomphosphaeria aponina SAG 52.96 = DSM 107014]
MNQNMTKCWRAIAASVTGSSHEKSGQPCQDAHNYRLLPNGVLVAAVADGAGSAPLAAIGAQIAVKTAVETISNLHPLPENESNLRLLLLDVLAFARDSVEAVAKTDNVPLKDLASTLIVVVATPENVQAAQVGDGAAVVRSGDGSIIPITTPVTGEYANETIFLTSPHALSLAQVNVWYGTPAQLAVFSDGLQRLALKIPEGIPHKPFFSPLFKFVAEAEDDTVALAQLHDFLKSPRVTSRTDDDLTLLLATSF